MPASLLHIPSPAKLNLFLHVTGRRADGYHNLQTLFQMLDYGDELDFYRREDGIIRLQTEFAGVPHDRNLIVRAARLLQQQTGRRFGTDIACLKRLPMGGGLGGGSSNAASTLVALNQLWETGLDINALAALGLQLGADVPVFVHGHTAWAEGIGEQLVPVDLPEKWYLVLVPDCAVSTAEIFNSPELTRNTSPITIAAFLGGGGHNDCQPVVARRYSAVQISLGWLGKFSSCQLTGTGSAIFAAFPTEKAARDVLQQLPARLDGNRISGFVARGLNISPIYTRFH
jgi:4-diphosphocytidyl-2-C-methyl-D-erythritol kinase